MNQSATLFTASRKMSMGQSRARALNRYVNSNLSAPEMKSIVVAAAPAANSGGSLTLLNIPLKGTTENSRVGSKISLRRLSLRGFCAVTPGTGVDQIHRVILVKDIAPEGVTPAITDILSSVSVYSFPVNESAWRFTILWDKTIDLSATAESGSIRSFGVSMPLGFPELFGPGSAGTIADIQSGSLYCIVIGTSSAGATAGSVSFNSLTEFTDE